MSSFIQSFPTTGRAPDILKVVAASLMVVDHANTLFLGATPLLWVVGRTVFPLFCFIVALHLSRGADGFHYFKKLLPFALLAQIPHTWVLWDVVMNASIDDFFVNVIFTLALGGLVASYVLKMPNWAKFGLFAVAVVGDPIFGHIEFGIIGVLMPAFFLMIIRGEKGGWFFTLLCFVFLNYDFQIMGWGPLSNLVYLGLVVIYTTLTLWIIFTVAKTKDGERFLPKYFLHFFYPGHFVALGLASKFL